MRLVTKLTTSNVRTWEELRKYVSQDLSGIADILNGGIDFTNFRAQTVIVDFTAANTNTKINHKLNKIPSGYLMAKISANMVIYDGAGDSTDQDIYLKSSAIGTATVIIF